MRVREELTTIDVLSTYTTEFRKRKLRDFGHMMLKAISEGSMAVRRKTGRLPRWWEDDIYEWTKLECNEVNMKVKDRVEWKRLCKGRHNPYNCEYI